MQRVTRKDEDWCVPWVIIVCLISKVQQSNLCESLHCLNFYLFIHFFIYDKVHDVCADVYVMR